MPEAKFSIAIVRDIVQYVIAHGGNLHQLCAAAHIDPAWLETPDRQVSGEVLKALWPTAIAQTGDLNLGLHIGESFDLSAIGIVGYVLFNCQTYGQVLDKLSQYTRLFSQGVAIHHQVNQGLVQCDCDIIGSLTNYLLEAPRHPIESTLVALVTATQQLTGNTLPVQSVWFQHPQPSDCTEHERIFQAPVQFSQPSNRLLFNAACLDWPVRSANSALLSVFERHATAMLSAQSQGQRYSQTVMTAISQHLQGTAPTIDIIARQLMVSVRQLQRELQTENTSYQKLLDTTRKELALEHLEHLDWSIHDVAFLLGFSEPSAFHRAFKRWTGQTPHHYRQQKL